jgi:hypothetical protein
MQNFIIGQYVNQEGQHYCNVIAKVSSIDDAKTIAENLNNSNELFKNYELISKISEKEIYEVQMQGDLWNQVDIVTLKEIQ